MQTLSELVNQAAALSDRPCTAVACAADTDVLESVNLAVSRGLATFKLFDDKELLIETISMKYPQLVNHPDIELIDSKGIQEAAQLAVEAVSTGSAQVLMKGNLPTATLMKAALQKK